MSEFPEVNKALSGLLEQISKHKGCERMPFGYARDVEVEYEGRIYEIKLSAPIYSQIRVIMPDEDK